MNIIRDLFEYKLSMNKANTILLLTVTLFVSIARTSDAIPKLLENFKSADLRKEDPMFLCIKNSSTDYLRVLISEKEGTKSANLPEKSKYSMSTITNAVDEDQEDEEHSPKTVEIFFEYCVYTTDQIAKHQDTDQKYRRRVQHFIGEHESIENYIATGMKEWCHYIVEEEFHDVKPDYVGEIEKEKTFNQLILPILREKNNHQCQIKPATHAKHSTQVRLGVKSEAPSMQTHVQGGSDSLNDREEDEEEESPKSLKNVQKSKSFSHHDENEEKENGSFKKKQASQSFLLI